VTWYFFFFFISGFCAVLYEVVWLRLVIAQFGVTTVMVSIVLSVFMAGLGLGSWASGVWLDRRHLDLPALQLYGIVELLVGLGGLVVPYELGLGRHLLGILALSSLHYAMSGLWILVTLLPWCTLMGATIPVAMRSIDQTFPKESARSFSFLYKANVAGAIAGTIFPLALIELLGFQSTLKVGVACNFSIGIAAIVLSRGLRQKESVPIQRAVKEEGTFGREKIILVLLFLSGLSSMGMEIVWVRIFTPYLGTVVYAFASILAVYLLAYYFGTVIYRKRGINLDSRTPVLWSLLGLFGLLPCLAANPEINLPTLLRLVLAIVPINLTLGFLTPLLVDRWSHGNPIDAGRAYAINVLGCILGPLVAGFILLPYMSELWALILLSVPWFILSLSERRSKAGSRVPARIVSYVVLILCFGLVQAGRSYERQYSNRSTVLRDHTATVIARGTGMNKLLLVNGYGMTTLTPETKMMAHLPLALLGRPPHNALDICFGMGTTFRSLLSWNIQVTAVELVPSVPRLFGYFHSDGPQLLRSPLSRVVVDDGRRFLERTAEQYDVITIDPPPPVEAAGSSLLYSEEFYAVASRRLRPDGILQQWLPYGDPQDLSSVARALQNSFRYVRVFQWPRDGGFHFLASNRQLPSYGAYELAQRLPPASADDLVEWGPRLTTKEQFEMILDGEIQIADLIGRSPSTPALSDDRPINEYFAIRHGLCIPKGGSASGPCSP
jgi:spermidine synthase